MFILFTSLVQSSPLTDDLMLDILLVLLIEPCGHETVFLAARIRPKTLAEVLQSYFDSMDGHDELPHRASDVGNILNPLNLL